MFRLIEQRVALEDVIDISWYFIAYKYIMTVASSFMKSLLILDKIKYKCLIC